jgi:hypothetical protein
MNVEKKKDEGGCVPDWKFVREFLQRDGKLTKA